MADLCVLQSALDISAALLAAGKLFMDDSEDSDDSDNDAESERPGPGLGKVATKALAGPKLWRPRKTPTGGNL